MKHGLCVALAACTLSCASITNGDVCGPGTHEDGGTCYPDDPDAGWYEPDARTGGDDAGNDGNDASPDATTGAPPLFAGSGDLVELFPIPAGAIVVASDAVVVIARDGSKKSSWASGRPITSAAFDGTNLVVADKAEFTVLDASLKVVHAGVALHESCGSSILVDGGRFVCGPSNDWDRVFYVYDVASGALLGSSAMYTYNGIPMHRVHGTNDFVTVDTDLSPAHFHLYRVPDSNAVQYLGESPDHGQFPVSDRYAITGSPGTDVVTETGLLLRIYPTTDAGTMAVPFVKTGDIGALANGESFVAIDQTSTATVGLVTTYGTSSSLCVQGCKLLQIDVANRTITSSRAYAVDSNVLVLLRHDRLANGAWLGHLPSGKDSYAMMPGFEVRLLAY